jgi:hypothetical protein
MYYNSIHYWLFGTTQTIIDSKISVALTLKVNLIVILMVNKSKDDSKKYDISITISVYYTV